MLRGSRKETQLHRNIQVNEVSARMDAMRYGDGRERRKPHK